MILCPSLPTSLSPSLPTLLCPSLPTSLFIPSSPSLSQLHPPPSLTKAEVPQMLTLLESFPQKASLNRRVSAKSLAASLLGVMATDEDWGWKDTPFP